MGATVQCKLNWCYAALLVSLICLGWLWVRSGNNLDQDCEQGCTVCYSCDGWNDAPVFEFGMYIFCGLLLFRLLNWAKAISRVELIAVLLCWLGAGFLLLAMDVPSIILTIRHGNRILLACLACYLALAPVIIALRYTPTAELTET
jgi:hypothetical protein